MRGLYVVESLAWSSPSHQSRSAASSPAGPALHLLHLSLAAALPSMPLLHAELLPLAWLMTASQGSLGSRSSS